MEAEETTSFAVNPWGSAQGFKLGDPARVLAVGRKHGLLPASSIEAMGRTAEEKLSNCSSMKLIQALEEAAELSSKLQEVELETHQYLLDKSTADFTHEEALDALLAKVNKLLGHLTEVVNKKDMILEQLQASKTEGTLTIDPPYQMHAHRLITSLGDSVTSAPSNLSALRQAHQLQLSNTELASKLSQTEKLLSQYQQVYRTAQKLLLVATSQDQSTITEQATPST